MNIPSSARPYTPSFLKFYDLIFNLTNILMWDVKVQKIHDLYTKYMHSECHLDIGPGSGLFLKNKNLKSVYLCDIQPAVLEMCSKFLTEEGVRVYTMKKDLYDHTPILGSYQSIGLNYVLHCISGDKKHILLAIQDALRSQGTFFGSTLLLDDDNHNIFAKKLIQICRKKRIFSHSEESEESVSHLLRSIFPNIRIERIGHALFFQSKK